MLLMMMLRMRRSKEPHVAWLAKEGHHKEQQDDEE